MLRRALIQELFLNSCSTVLFFLLTRSKMCGARNFGASPSSQLWCQNFVFFPLPIETLVEALKRKRSDALHGTSEPAQGLSSSVHSCHNHRRCRARPNLSRSSTPSPPKSLGWLTVGQFTKQCPPLVLSSPFQRKERRILSICFLAQVAVVSVSGVRMCWVF